jgi:S1-C subfamily serine protease
MSGAPARVSLPAEESVHTQIYQKYSGTVVGINCRKKDPKPDEIGDFFGTGAVVSPDGLILTCLTVVPEDACDIKVYFVDGRVMTGTVKRLDKASEAVLLHVNASKLACMRLADSAACQLGDPVYSWGNPYHTIMKDGMVCLSTGTISGLYRVSSVDPESRYLGPVLETDAAVNPGSDGGPLTDAAGNLLGLQSLAYSRTRWLGTVIPVHVMAKNMPELRKIGVAPRVSFTGARARVWAVARAFPQVIGPAAAATVSLRVVREGDKTEPPARRQDEKLEALPPHPNDLRRSLREMAAPAEAYVSGVTVAPEGIVLTASYHFEQTAGRRKVKTVYAYLADGTRVRTKLLGRDNYYDLAVLQLVGPTNRVYPYLPVAGGLSPSPGYSVAVLGRSEMGGALTLNSGPVSATNRFKGTCSQIGAMVNYGNLGGPVVDLRGRLVGLATKLSAVSDWRQNCGVAFMLDAPTLTRLLPLLKEGREVEHPRRPFLGVQGDVEAADAKGARVRRVVPDYPAAKAGLKDLDVIFEFNGVKVEDWGGLLRAIETTKPDQTVKLKLRRGDQELEKEVTLTHLE